MQDDPSAVRKAELIAQIQEKLERQRKCMQEAGELPPEMPPSATPPEPPHPAEPASPQAEPAALPLSGPKDRTEADFSRIAHYGTCKVALAEFQRTLKEFRETGAAAEKPWDHADFAHLRNPPRLRGEVYNAHCEAVEEIAAWKDGQAKRARLSEVGLARARAAETEADKTAPEDPSGRAPPDNKVPEIPAPEPPAPAEPPPGPVELRGEAFVPEAHSNNRYFSHSIPRLDIARDGAPAPGEGLRETHAGLNGLIGECHFLMREVVFRSICQSSLLQDRIDLLNTAMRLAETGAKVGDSAGRLHHGPQVAQTAHELTVRRVVTAEIPREGV